MNVSYDLERFVIAQNRCFDAALAELKSGHPTAAWMSCVFPQLEGLEFSETSEFYAIRDRDEAAAYLNHPVLGPRLIQCTKLAIHHAISSSGALFEPQQDQTFHASMSLFSRVKGASAVFESALFAFYGGTADPRTLKMLRLAFTAMLDD